jgi:hypothetical protein
LSGQAVSGVIVAEGFQEDDMKALALAGVLAGIAAAGAAQAAAPPGTHNICIRSYQIDHTKAQNDKTLIFYMKDGSQYQSMLTSTCPELSLYGFAYSPKPPDEICGNLQTIRVIRTGSVCLLGPLVPIGPKSGSAY